MPRPIVKDNRVRTRRYETNDISNDANSEVANEGRNFYYFEFITLAHRALIVLVTLVAALITDESPEKAQGMRVLVVVVTMCSVVGMLALQSRFEPFDADEADTLAKWSYIGQFGVAAGGAISAVTAPEGRKRDTHIVGDVVLSLLVIAAAMTPIVVWAKQWHAARTTISEQATSVDNPISEELEREVTSPNDDDDDDEDDDDVQ